MHWGVAVNTDKASLTQQLLTSCCVAQRLTGQSVAQEPGTPAGRLAWSSPVFLHGKPMGREAWKATVHRVAESRT